MRVNNISINEAIAEQTSRFSEPRGKGRYENDGSKKLREKADTGWNVQDIQQQHHRIKDLIFLGYSNVEIAKTLNCTAQQVANVKNSPIIKDQLLLMQVAAEGGAVDIQKEILKLQPHALKVLKEVIESGTLNGMEVEASSRIKECNTIIDRYIGKPTQNIKTQGVTAHLTFDEIEKLKDRMMEQMKEVRENVA